MMQRKVLKMEKCVNFPIESNERNEDLGFKVKRHTFCTVYR